MWSVYFNSGVSASFASASAHTSSTLMRTSAADTPRFTFGPGAAQAQGERGRGAQVQPLEHPGSDPSRQPGLRVQPSANPWSCSSRCGRSSCQDADTQSVF